MVYLSLKRNDAATDNNLLLSGSFYSLVIRVFSVFMAFAVQAVLARQLGTTSFGEYTYILTWAILIAHLACLGFDTSIVRYVSVYKARSEWELLGGIVRIGFLVPLAVSITLACVCVVLVHYQVISIRFLQYESLLFGAALMPFLTTALIRQAILRALKRVVFAQIPDAIIRPVILIVLVSTWYWMSNGVITTYEVILVHILAATVSLAIGTYFIYRVLPRSTKRSYFYSRWISTSIPLLLASAMTLLMSKSDIVMVGFLISPKDSGIYAVASQFSELTAFGLIAANTILAPMISSFYATSQQAKIQSIVTFATRIASVFAIIVALMFVMFGKYFLEIYGPKFVLGYVPLGILLVGQLFNTFSGCVAAILSMTGHESFAARIVFIATLLNIFLNYILIPRYGLVGAAIATSVSIIFWNATMAVYVWRKMRINTTVFAYET